MLEAAAAAVWHRESFLYFYIFCSGGIIMSNENNTHYRVSMRRVRQDPAEGLYVTKQEQRKYFLFTLGIVLLSMLSFLPLSSNKK